MERRRLPHERADVSIVSRNFVAIFQLVLRPPSIECESLGFSIDAGEVSVREWLRSHSPYRALVAAGVIVGPHASVVLGRELFATVLSYLRTIRPETRMRFIERKGRLRDCICVVEIPFRLGKKKK